MHTETKVKLKTSELIGIAVFLLGSMALGLALFIGVFDETNTSKSIPNVTPSSCSIICAGCNGIAAGDTRDCYKQNEEAYCNCVKKQCSDGTQGETTQTGCKVLSSKPI